jgi:hypothetical protein
MIQEALGFKARMFDSVVSYSVGDTKRADTGSCVSLLKNIVSTITHVPNLSPDMLRDIIDAEFTPAEMIVTPADIKNVESFLDAFFAGGSDFDPREKRSCVTNLDWGDIYRDSYVPACIDVCKPVSESEFCHIRKTYRPNYRKAQQTKKGKNICIDTVIVMCVKDIYDV